MAPRTVPDTPQKAALVAEQLLDILQIKPTDIDGLYSMPVERLLAAQQELGPRLRKMGQLPDLALQPVIDGSVLPKSPINAVRKGEAKVIPIIVGTNLDEWKIMNARNPEIQKLDEANLLKRVQRILPSLDVTSAGRYLPEIFSQIGVYLINRQIYSLQLKPPKNSGYRRFAWRSTAKTRAVGF